MPEIEFTREELADELLSLKHEITNGRVDSDLISLAAFAISQFDETVSTEVNEGVIDEAEAIEYEDFRKKIADELHEASKAQIGNTPNVNLLSRHRDTPRADAKRKADEIARDAERKVNADRVLEEISLVEAKHTVTSQMLRHSRYVDPTTEPHERNGTWLAHKIEEIVDNGSEISVFTSQEAKMLAGNALAEKSHAYAVKLKQDLGYLAKLHEQAKFFGAQVNPGLFSGVSKLKELAETAMLEKRPDLKELYRFIELLEAPSEDLFEQVTEELDEGPFKDCSELETLPFPPNSEQNRAGSLKEISSEDANEDNILDDIKKAVKSSGATEYIIEERRVTEFVGLKEHLERKYPGNIKIYRSLKSNWHPLPWYVIEIAQPNDPPMVVLESPIYGNATYYINNGDWPSTIEFKRRDAQQLGAKPIIHAVAEGQTLAMHTNRIKAIVQSGYKA